jgi:hypothetical protein
VLLLGVLQNIFAQNINEAGASIDHPGKKLFFSLKKKKKKHFRHSTNV